MAIIASRMKETCSNSQSNSSELIFNTLQIEYRVDTDVFKRPLSILLICEISIPKSFASFS